MVFAKAKAWYDMVRQRLQPGGNIVICMTRQGKNDLVGAILNSSGAKDWRVVEFPAIFPNGKHIFPEQWTLERWLKLKEEMPAFRWNAVYQQNPTSDESALVKREWWRPWPQENVKAEDIECEYIIQSWDLPYKKTTTSDFAACTTWGVVKVEERNPDGIVHVHQGVVLLESFNERLEFPDMKRKAKEFYKKWKPDSLIVEAKAAGAPLVAELREMNIPVSDFIPSRGNDKIMRVNAVTDLFKSGYIYVVQTKANLDTVDQFASFAAHGTSDHDDLVDSGTQALLRFRQGGFIKTANDEIEERKPVRKKRGYYSV